MYSYSFNYMDPDVLKEVANIGTGNAATSLSKMIGATIRMTVPEVNMQDFNQLAYAINGPENIVIAVLVYITGDISGMVMYVMEEESACTLVDLMMHKKVADLQSFDEMDVSLITEVGNILCSSYLSALSTLLNLKIRPSVPSPSIDMAAAVLSVPAIEFGKIGDKVLFIKSNFGAEQKVPGYFILVPEVIE